MATVQPKNSAHGPARVRPTGEDSGGESAPVAATQMPSLAMIWGDAPPITANQGPETPSGQGGGATGGSHPQLTVDLGSVRESVQGLLNSSRTAVDQYMVMKQRVETAVAGGTVFGQNAQRKVDNTQFNFFTGQWSWDNDGPSLEPDKPLQEAALKFAAQMNPAMTQVMRECADALELAGQFIVLLDRAGTAYAHADYASVFPDAPIGPVVDT
ncbi:hypothetical protein [Streptomyces sp. NPDC060198]|uniref:hypothetical protein n=1 Tax=Streptomyces sp. NPDC060198 TaxID=3347070 RepID=UPI003651CF36